MGKPFTDSAVAMERRDYKIYERELLLPLQLSEGATLLSVRKVFQIC